MKALFHDEEERNPEPVPGLPERLPEGEQIIWQGGPSALGLAVHALHIRFVALYFAVFTLWRLAFIASQGGGAAEMASVVTTSLIGVLISGALLLGLGFVMARATIYTVTDKRVVLRYGAAIRKYVNIPFRSIEAAALRRHGRSVGSIALATTDEKRIGYLHLWPHARPWRYSAPQPMLRTVPNADRVADILCQTMKAHAPAAVSVTLSDEISTRPPAIGADAVAPA